MVNTKKNAINAKEMGELKTHILYIKEKVDNISSELKDANKNIYALDEKIAKTDGKTNDCQNRLKVLEENFKGVVIKIVSVVSVVATIIGALLGNVFKIGKV